MSIATLGTTPESLLGVNPSQILVLDAADGKTLLRGVDAAGQHVQRAVVAMTGADRALMVRQGGCAVYTITRNAAGAPTATQENESLGTHLGFDLAVTHAFRGHDSRSLKVKSTSDGAFVASRDDGGKVILWSRTGSAYSATTLPFNVGAAPRTFSRLRFSQWGLTAVMPDGSVQVVELPFSGPCNCKVFFENDKQITAVTALRISSDEILLGLDDGRLCKASLGSGQITAVVINPGATPRTFRHLLYSPASQRVAAVPDWVLDQGLAISVLSVRQCQVVGEIRNRWKSIVAGLDGAGRLLVSALGKHGVFFYDLAGSTSLVARFPKRARVGVAAFNDKLVLAANRSGLRLVKYEPGIYGMEGLLFPHLPVSSVGGAPGASPGDCEVTRARRGRRASIALRRCLEPRRLAGGIAMPRARRGPRASIALRLRCPEPRRLAGGLRSHSCAARAPRLHHVAALPGVQGAVCAGLPGQLSLDGDDRVGGEGDQQAAAALRDGVGVLGFQSDLNLVVRIVVDRIGAHFQVGDLVLEVAEQGGQVPFLEGREDASEMEGRFGEALPDGAEFLPQDRGVAGKDVDVFQLRHREEEPVGKEELGALREMGHGEIDLGPFLAEELLDGRGHPFIEDEGAVEGPGDGREGEVVVGGPHAPAGDHDVVAPRKAFHRRCDLFLVVGNDGHAFDASAQGMKFPHQERGVDVLHLAGEDLVADDDDAVTCGVGVHGGYDAPLHPFGPAQDQEEVDPCGFSLSATPISAVT